MAALTNQARRCLRPVSAGRGAPDGDRPKAAMSSSPELDSDFASEISRGAGAARPAAGDLDLADRHALRRVTGLSHRARRRHRGRVPRTAAGAGRTDRSLDRGHAGQRGELIAGALTARGDGWFCGARPGSSSGGAARPGNLRRLRARPRTGRHRRRERRGHGDLRRRADPRPAAQPRGHREGQGRRPDRAHPGHLRPGTPGPRPARPRWSWHSWSTCCPGCAAGASR